MRGSGKRKSWIMYTVLAITIVIGLVFASGCSNTSLGSTQVADFGNSKDAEQVQNCFINKYGNPAMYSGPPRFLEPMVSDGIVNNTPTNKVSKFSRDTPSVYVWAFYEGFKPGDQVTVVWTFNGQQFASLSKQIGGNYGSVYGQFDKPTSGWAVGTHTITISGNGVQGSATFDIIDGATVTEPLPCQDATAQDGQKVKPAAGGPLNVITTEPTRDKLGVVPPCTYTQIAEWGSEGTNPGQFITPMGIAVDSVGNVYVIDQGGNRIQKFDATGNYRRTWGSKGTGEGQFSQPHAIAIDSAGNVYVADTYNDRIQKFDANGNYLSQWGSEGTDPGQFSSPFGIAVDSARNVYVVETHNNRIQKFDSDGNYLSQWGSKGTGEGQFSQPLAIAVDSSGNVYVIELSGRIQKFNSDGNYLSQWLTTGSYTIAVDSVGNIYVSDINKNQIQKFSCIVSTSQAPATPTTTPPVAVAIKTTPTIVHACWTQAKVLTPTLIPSLNPTPVPTTPQVIHLNTTPTTPIPRYKGYSI